MEGVVLYFIEQIEREGLVSMRVSERVSLRGERGMNWKTLEQIERVNVRGSEGVSIESALCPGDLQPFPGHG